MNRDFLSDKLQADQPARAGKWYIVSVILFLPLFVVAVLSTVFVMIMLNGYPSLPDAMVTLYLTGATFLIIGFSIVAGWLAKKLSSTISVPLWLSGVLTGGVFMVVMPFALLVLTFGLLAVFGLL